MVDALVAPVVGGGVGCAVAAVVWRLVASPLSRRPRLMAVPVVLAAMVTGLTLRLPVLASAGPVAIGFLAVELERRERRARDRRRQAGLPVVVDTMIQQLRSGTGLRTACVAPVAVGPEVVEMLRPLVAALERQRPLREAVSGLQAEATNRGWHDAQLFAATLAALVDRGGPAVPALQRLRLTLMGAVEARSRAESQAGQARASAALLAGAPALFALVVAVADTKVGHFYLREPAGGLCVAVALLLSMGGWRWMNRVVGRALRHHDSGVDRRRGVRR